MAWKLHLQESCQKISQKGSGVVGTGFANARRMPDRKSAGAVHIEYRQELGKTLGIFLTIFRNIFCYCKKCAKNLKAGAASILVGETSRYLAPMILVSAGFEKT
jgi:hypothetical protein